LGQQYHIYVPEKYYNESFNTSLKNIIPKCNLVPYSFKSLPKGFKELRRFINGKVFTNNLDLERRIRKFNSILMQRAIELNTLNIKESD